MKKILAMCAALIVGTSLIAYGIITNETTQDAIVKDEFDTYGYAARTDIDTLKIGNVDIDADRFYRASSKTTITSSSATEENYNIYFSSASSTLYIRNLDMVKATSGWPSTSFRLEMKGATKKTVRVRYEGENSLLTTDNMSATDGWGIYANGAGLGMIEFYAASQDSSIKFGGGFSGSYVDAPMTFYGGNATFHSYNSDDIGLHVNGVFANAANLIAIGRDYGAKINLGKVRNMLVNGSTLRGIGGYGGFLVDKTYHVKGVVAEPVGGVLANYTYPVEMNQEDEFITVVDENGVGVKNTLLDKIAIDKDNPLPDDILSGDYNDLEWPSCPPSDIYSDVDDEKPVFDNGNTSTPDADNDGAFETDNDKTTDSGMSLPGKVVSTIKNAVYDVISYNWYITGGVTLLIALFTIFTILFTKRAVPDVILIPESTKATGYARILKDKISHDSRRKVEMDARGEFQKRVAKHLNDDAEIIIVKDESKRTHKVSLVDGSQMKEVEIEAKDI